MIARRQPSFSIVVMMLLLAAVLGRAQQPKYDFIIQGARIVDGTGAPLICWGHCDCRRPHRGHRRFA
jgi:hypothetical protein